MTAQALEAHVNEANQAMANLSAHPDDPACRAVAEAVRSEMRALSKIGVVGVGPDGWVVL